MTDKEKNWPVVAMLAGSDPSVIDAIVKQASKDAKCKMNWGYVAGRAIVHSRGNKAKCRKHLRFLIPQTDIEREEMWI